MTRSYTEPDFPHIDWRYNGTIKRLSDTSIVMLGRTFTSPLALNLLDVANSSKNLVIKCTADASIPTSLYSPPQHISFPRIFETEKEDKLKLTQSSPRPTTPHTGRRLAHSHRSSYPFTAVQQSIFRKP
jgi:hypothetical protein